MDHTTIRLLRQILDRELALHRELLAMARLRHILLRQGRITDLHVLHPTEATKVAEVRHLEHMRGALAARVHDGGAPRDLTDRSRRIGALIRRIGSVERANRALVARYAVRVASGDRGLAVWMSP